MEEKERGICVFAFLPEEKGEEERRILELQGIVSSCGGSCVDVFQQHLDRMQPATVIGSGKVLELQDLVDQWRAQFVVFDRALTGAQMKNLSDMLPCKVLDRIDLILDIFALRARSKKAKLDVKLAQLSYRLPRLRGLGGQLSRTGGGIGTRGPGEQQLETDRRAILREISGIREQRKKIGVRERMMAKQREEGEIPIVSLVGYTNVGKSTLLNGLRSLCQENEGSGRDKEVYADDRLFATLDVHLRRLQREGEPAFLLADTVGFITDLPEKLKSAFESTLAEAKRSQLLLVVLDASNPHCEEDRIAVLSLLKESLEGIPICFVYNKMDRARVHPNLNPGMDLSVSAKKKEDLEALYSLLIRRLFGKEIAKNFLIPYSSMNLFSDLRDQVHVDREEGTPEGYRVSLRLREKQYRELSAFAKEVSDE